MSSEFQARLFAGEDEVEVRRNDGFTWLEHLALSLYHFDKFSPAKGIKHGLYACAGFGSGVQGVSRILGSTTVVIDRELMVREMQAYLNRVGKQFAVKPDTDFAMFDCMSAALMADALPPLKALDSGDLELISTLFSKYIAAVPAGMGFVYLAKPKAKGGIDLDLVKPPLWRRLFRGEVIGREVAPDDVWSAAVEHMIGRVEAASLLPDRYADSLAASLKHLEKKAPAALRRDFADLSSELADAREARRTGGPWGRQSD